MKHSFIVLAALILGLAGCTQRTKMYSPEEYGKHADSVFREGKQLGRNSCLDSIAASLRIRDEHEREIAQRKKDAALKAKSQKKKKVVEIQNFDVSRDEDGKYTMTPRINEAE
jgi:hypothetical protein